ncbi:MAG: hypothetical protein D6702_03750 [Planctomycetota bacterium]|nr:MAG: hypothetical protein D6702_03750 [Planctomycetota bacterium]
MRAAHHRRDPIEAGIPVTGGLLPDQEVNEPVGRKPTRSGPERPVVGEEPAGPNASSRSR